MDAYNFSFFTWALVGLEKYALTTTLGFSKRILMTY
jgi:hypothetical protein